MKKTVLAAAFFFAALFMYGQQRSEYDLFGWNVYPKDGSFTVRGEGAGIRVSGKASGSADGGAGYVIEFDKPDSAFYNAGKIILRITDSEGNQNSYSGNRLLKLEVNDTPLATATRGMANRIDPKFINARDGEAEFDITHIRRNIRKINLYFYDCALSNVKIEMFIQ